MMRDNFSQSNSQKKSRMGILFGIPILIFSMGIVLISIGSYNYLKTAYYLSRLFIHDDYKTSSAAIENTQVETTINTNNKSNNNIVKLPNYGEEFGELIINKASIDVPVYHGDSEDILLKGVGHYSGSRFPGQGSNIVLAGHRNSVFKNFKKVVIGDTIEFDTTYGKYIYKIRATKIIDPTDNSITQPTNKEQLTLYTCYPFDYVGHAPNRYVIICDLVEGSPIKTALQKEEASN